MLISHMNVKNVHVNIIHACTYKCPCTETGKHKLSSNWSQVSSLIMKHTYIYIINTISIFKNFETNVKFRNPGDT